MAKRLGPEARIIALYSALSEDSKRIVLDVLKSQQPVVKRGKPAPSVKVKSKQKNAEISFGHNIEEETENVLIATGD